MIMQLLSNYPLTWRDFTAHTHFKDVLHQFYGSREGFSAIRAVRSLPSLRVCHIRKVDNEFSFTLSSDT